MSEEGKKFCPHCGKAVKVGSKFCQFCGTPVKQNENQEVADVAEIPETVAESEVENVSKTEEILEAERIPEAESAPETESIPEAESAPETESIPEAESAPETESIPGSGSGSGNKGMNNPISGKNFNMSKKTMQKIGAAVAALVIIIILAVNHKPTVKLNKYLTIKVSGYDTVGEAYYEFDQDKFIEDYGSKIKFNKKKIKSSNEEYNELMNYFGDEFSSALGVKPADILLESCVDGKLNKTSGLKNGDKVTYKWKCNEKLAEDLFGCKLKYSEMTEKVKGLKKVKKFNPFKNVKMVYSGISGEGEATVDMKVSDDDMGSVIDFTIPKNGELKNGDKITVSVDKSVAEYCASEYGKIPDPAKKEYTVTGLPAYVSKVSEIPKEALEKMKKEADDYYNAQVAENWDEEDEQLVSRNFIGTYFLKAKTGTGNKLYLVYKNEIRHIYKDDDFSFDKVCPIYWYVEYDDIMVDDKGKMDIDYTEYSTPYDFVLTESKEDNWFARNWRNEGYDSLDTLYKKVVTAQLDNYAHEDNVKDPEKKDTEKSE